MTRVLLPWPLGFQGMASGLLAKLEPHLAQLSNGAFAPCPPLGSWGCSVWTGGGGEVLTPWLSNPLAL